MRARLLVVLLGLAVALLLWWRPGAGVERREVGLPPQLAGVWTSNDPRYAGRFLEFRPEAVVFGQGEEGEARHPLVGVFVEEPATEPSAYVVVYEIDGGASGVLRSEMRVPFRNGALRLASSPDVVWTRER